MMVKVSAYRLKHIHLQIYNFHLEEATFLSKSQGLPIAVNEDFLILQVRKCIKFPVPLIQVFKSFSCHEKTSCYRNLQNTVVGTIKHCKSIR